MIRIKLLGSFAIYGEDGQEAAVADFTAVQRFLFQFLLLSKEKRISASDLPDAFFTQTASRDKDLRTAIQRLNTVLGRLLGTSEKAIETLEDTYRISREWLHQTDVFVFEARCSLLTQKEAPDEETSGLIDSIQSLYTVDLDTTCDMGERLENFKTIYHIMYLRSMYHAIRLLRLARDFEGVIRVCRRALEVDAFDESIRSELMKALMRTENEFGMELLGQNTMLAAEDYAVEVRPSGRFQNLYRQIINVDQALGVDIENVRDSLTERETSKGALYCDYSIFRDIFQIMQRNFSRQTTHVYLVVLMIGTSDSEEISPFLLDNAMQSLREIMVAALRRGDTIARYSPSHFALLLSSVNAQTSRLVMERVRNAFYEKYKNTNLTLSYRLCDMMDRGEEE